MNYIVEDGIDFFAELAKSDDESVGDDTNTCLLSGTPLSRNYITLKCGHKFNYYSLFNEIVKQKTIYNPNDNVRLSINEIKCPYCRQISDHLLPYIPCEKGVAKIYGVNSPKTMCMKHKTCEWRFKTGNRRGILCQHDGFETEYGTMCEQHWKKAQMKYSKQKNGLSEQIEWTKEMEDLFQRNTVISLKNKLRENKQKVSGSKKELVIRLISNK
tara:strand:+ start:8313 stop:8954 length:642 start_codon:yes stop_codon:yes gene_type:complete